jgi:hypothetical protein
MSISASLVPSQESTRQGMVNPNQFSNQRFWSFDAERDPNGFTWQPSVAEYSNLNYFTKDEPHQQVKNGMFNPLTGQEPVYGQTDYHLSPLDQEQTNSHMSGYGLQKQTRVADNMNPAGVMRFPSYTYPTPRWQTVYEGRAQPMKTSAFT